MRKTLLAVLGWLLAAAIAATMGTLAVSLLGTGITGEQVHPLSEDAVARALAQSTPRPSSSPSPTAGPRTTPSPSATSSRTASPSVEGSRSQIRALGSRGGSVIARCTGSTVYLVSWTPRQGFEVDDYVRGPINTASVNFESETVDVVMSVGCRAGLPVSLVTAEVDD